MSTITPIIIPVPTPPAHCPQCHRTENRIEVCAHCGYQYEDAGMSGRDLLVAIGIIIVALIAISWVFITAMEWLIGYSNRTLLEIVQDQWRWIASRRVW